MIAQEHEHEPVPGLPESLPEGERILWQGAPDWRVLAVEAFHARKIAVYFALLAAWGVVEALAGAPGAAGGIAASRWGATAVAMVAMVAVGAPIALGAAAIAIVLGLSWLASRSTLYTITNRRVVLRIGIVLGITFNLPFRAIETIGLRLHRGGRGDVPLALDDEAKIAYLMLWPHARPWRLAKPQPMLRAIPGAAVVARLLAEAIAACPSSVTDVAPDAVSAVEDRGAAARAPLPAPAGVLARDPAIDVPRGAEACHA